MGINARHRLAAFAVAVSATFSLVWAHASVAYPSGTAPAVLPMVLAKACR